MAQFEQPINREADLEAILNGYEQAIQKESWLSEAIQKDGIQNAWGARINKRGEGWSCSITFKSSSESKPDTLIIEDTGTHGLTGKIPETKAEETEILMSHDSHQRLGRFLSSNWSMKTEHSLGSRGRGKMVFVGASELNCMYFDSVRADDGVYVFGSTYLDSNKAMQVEIFSGHEAEQHRADRLGKDFPSMKASGTRIIIPSPRKEVAEMFKSNEIASAIQETWWEILQKHNAQIKSGLYETPQKVGVSSWLPIANSGIAEAKTYPDVDVGGGLKIKKISLVYLKGRSVPDEYQGITIQRDGMKIQTKRIGEYVSELPNNSVYGSVEFDKNLNDAMLTVEGPEHYNFFWNRSLSIAVKRAITLKVLDFAREYKIIENDKPSTKKVREAEVAVLKELNDIARSLGLSGVGHIRQRRKKPGPQPTPNEPIRLVVPEFETPATTGRANYGEEIRGVYAVGQSDFDEPLKVLIETWIYKDGGGGFMNMSHKKELEIGQKINPLKIGWDSLAIDDKFPRGQYHLKARMTALEDKKLGEIYIKKADILFGEVSRSFWVEEEPPARGFWKDTRRSDRENNRFVWWQDDGDGYILLWNGNHPLLKEAAEGDDDYLQTILRQEGTYAFWAIVLATCIDDPDSISNKLKKITESISEQSLEMKIDWLMQQRSKTLWK